MIITFDTEFHDDGRTTELISIGMVAEDGKEFYAVNGDADWRRIGRENAWVVEHVLTPHIPRATHMGEWRAGAGWWPNQDAEDVLTKDAIAVEVEHFLIDAENRDGGRAPELWAYYSATDHVVGYQLFGSMIVASRDHGWPMRTSCLKQHEETMIRRLARDLGCGYEHAEKIFNDPPRPVQPEGTEHHALHDARHDMDLARWMGVPELARAGSA